MLHAIKHLSIRLWLTVLLGGMLALVSLPALQKPLGLEWAFVAAVPMFVSVFFALGWVFNRTSLRIVRRLLNEADVWERAGDNRQAEKLLRKAVSVCDSFLMSPFNKSKRSRSLTGHMARFYLTQNDDRPHAQSVIQAYLKIRPQDRDVAEAWLQHLARQNGFQKEHEDVLHRIERAQSKHPHIQSAIARIYLQAGRADFQALQTYRRLVESKQKLDKSTLIRLAELLWRHKRTDAWVLHVYLAAHRLNPKSDHYRQGMAACLHWAPDVHAGTVVFKKVRSLLADFDASALEKMSATFRPAEKTPPHPPKRHFRSMARKVLPACRSAARAMASVPVRLGAALTALSRRIRGYPDFRPLFRWTVVGLLGVGLSVLVVNTARHLQQSKPTLEEIEPPQVVEITDPFTLQVAAYLKSEQAEKYVRQLKAQGLDAYWTTAQGAKRKWYQVRLSHFADKESARAYGEDLKTRGIIDDFYVANYQRP